MKMGLAAWDFSGATPRVLEVAVNLAQAVGDHLVLLHVARLRAGGKGRSVIFAAANPSS
jgi:hypothetical protein